MASIKETKESISQKAERYWKLYVECDKKLNILEKQVSSLQMDLAMSENRLRLEKERATELRAKLEMLKDIFKPRIITICPEVKGYSESERKKYFEDI